MNPQTAMPDLLHQAGFRVHGRRADCIHCNGDSRLTVSFTDEVVYCHRCHWTANVRTLARSLGVAVAALRPEDLAKQKLDADFKEWEDTCYILLMRRLQFLARRAALAKQVLDLYPDCDPAWAALADFCHNESALTAAFETLGYEKVPVYLEEPITRARLHAAFGEVATRSSRAA